MLYFPPKKKRLQGIGILLWVSLFVIMSATAQAEPSFEKVELEVIPGESVGPIRIGERLGSQVYRVLGRPHAHLRDRAIWSKDLEGATGPIGVDTGIFVKLDAHQRVTAISVSDVKATTSAGFALDGTPEDLKRLHPHVTFKAARFTLGEYSCPGITFTMRSSEKSIDQIRVRAIDDPSLLTVNKLLKNHQRTNDAKKTVRLSESLLTPGFLGVLDRALAGQIGGDFILGGQAGFDNYEVAFSSQHNGKWTVPVYVWGGRSDPKDLRERRCPRSKVVFHLTDVGAGPQIYDIEHGKASVRKQLLESAIRQGN